MLQDTEILPILVLKDDTLLTKIHKQQSPGLPNQELHREEIETILFTTGPILFVKFTKILALRSTPRIMKTVEITHKEPMQPDTRKNFILVLDQGQDPGGHHLLPRQEQGPLDPPLVVLHFDPRPSKTPSVDLTIQKLLPLKPMNPNRLRFLLQKKVKLLIGEDLLRNVMKMMTKMS